MSVFSFFFFFYLYLLFCVWLLFLCCFLLLFHHLLCCLLFTFCYLISIQSLSPSGIVKISLYNIIHFMHHFCTECFPPYFYCKMHWTCLCILLAILIHFCYIFTFLQNLKYVCPMVIATRLLFHFGIFLPNACTIFICCDCVSN